MSYLSSSNYLKQKNLACAKKTEADERTAGDIAMEALLITGAVGGTGALFYGAYRGIKAVVTKGESVD